jgi:uncharacterized protein (DUF1800 family)
MKAVALVCAAMVAAGMVRDGVAEVRPPADPDSIIHVLNRVAFGPAAGDVVRVRRLGIERYIDQQLHPERIDDSAMTARLQAFTTLTMASRELARRYEQPLLEARKAQKNSAADEPAPMRRAAQMSASSVLVELSGQKVLRAVYSERQLQEVLTDFWFNHFNVDARKGPERFLLTEYERDVIRPHVLGRFRDLLGATAKSPAMLFYLDNWLSVDPNAQPARPRQQQQPPSQQQQARRGLNENYARELMELHTLGVDGGYTQKDVTEVARAFTGWSIDRPREGGDFRFQPRMHDPGEKVVLGHVIKPAAFGSGQSEGETVLDILARHPSTARFIATKLARRFVSDDPPKSLIDRAAARFRETEGDLREVVRVILLSKEFAAAESFNAKAKTPFEFLVSAVRAAGTDAPETRALVRTMQELGMPLYQCQPPTGYADTADAWINTGALVARMNVATRVAGGDQQLALTLGSPEFQRR